MTTGGKPRPWVQQVGEIIDALREADPADRAEVYRQLGLRLTYHPDQRKVRVQSHLAAHPRGNVIVSGGGLEPPRPVRALAPQASASAIPPPGRVHPTLPVRLGGSQQRTTGPARHAVPDCTPPAPERRRGGRFHGCTRTWEPRCGPAEGARVGPGAGAGPAPAVRGATHGLRRPDAG